MGQYHYIVNLDKKEFLHPWYFGCGLKLGEFSFGNTLTALSVLLAAHNGRGGGDFHITDPIVGSWAGDRIAIVGDYGPDDTTETELTHLYKIAEQTYANISDQVIIAMCQDDDLRTSLNEGMEWRYLIDDLPTPPEVAIALGSRYSSF